MYTLLKLKNNRDLIKKSNKVPDINFYDYIKQKDNHKKIKEIPYDEKYDTTNYRYILLWAKNVHFQTKNL